MKEKAFPMSSIVPPGPDCLGFVWPLFLYENLSGQPLIVEVTAVSGFGGGGGGGGRGKKVIHYQFSPYMVLVRPYMMKIDSEYRLCPSPWIRYC